MVDAGDSVCRSRAARCHPAAVPVPEYGVLLPQLVGLTIISVTVVVTHVAFRGNHPSSSAEPRFVSPFSRGSSALRPELDAYTGAGSVGARVFACRLGAVSRGLQLSTPSHSVTDHGGNTLLQLVPGHTAACGRCVVQRWSAGLGETSSQVVVVGVGDFDIRPIAGA
jgi:hypothetical protein